MVWLIAWLGTCSFDSLMGFYLSLNGGLCWVWWFWGLLAVSVCLLFVWFRDWLVLFYKVVGFWGCVTYGCLPVY